MKNIFLYLVPIVLLASVFNIGFVIQPVRAEPDIILVPDNYLTIQEAINHASVGDTVFVRAGTYHGNVVINKTVALIGENRNTTIIDGNETVIRIEAFNVTVENFTICSSENITETQKYPIDYGIRLSTFPPIPFRAPNVTIENNNIMNSKIALYVNAENNEIKGNIIELNELGIVIRGGPHNKVINNTISNNTFGLYLTSGNFLRQNKMLENKFNLVTASSSPQDDVDVSNTVNGKLVCYMVNQTNLNINPSTFPNIGYLALINCSHITVRDLTLRHNGEGIRLSRSTNCTFERNVLVDNVRGIYGDASNTSFCDNVISENYQGIELTGNYNKLTNNTIAGNTLRLAPVDLAQNWPYLFYCIGESMTDELLWYSGGIFLTNANDCTITDNNITGNERGMVLYHSSSNSLRRNNMTDNFYNFGVEFDIGPTSYLENDVDTSNTLNGKPIYWWINRHNEQVPADAGYVVVVNSTNIDVRNLVLEKNIHGILLVNVNNSIVFNNTVTGSKYGIFVRPAYMDTLCNNTVANNHVTAGGAGICLSAVNSTVCNNSLDGNLVGIYVPDSHNLVIGNNVTNHKFPPMEEWIWRRVPPHYMPFIYDSDEAVGVFLAGSNNTACYNTIQDNSYGLKTWNSGNSIHHNNFINNQKQLSVSSINEWDDGYPSGGNYWSDYNNRDSKWGQSQNQTGSDGIGDTPYYLAQWVDPPSFTQEPSISDQYDYYPLMAPISTFYAGAWDEVSYYVDVVSNSTVSAFHFDPKKGALLRFSVTGESETNGFCRVTIPRDLLQVEDGCTVLVGLESTNYTLVSGESCAYLYFTYDHSTKTVYVIGTYVVPEFASTMMAHLFFVLITLAIVLSKKKSPKNTHSLESLKAYDAGFRIYDNTCRQMF